MYSYQMFRVVMRGFDRDEVLAYLQQHDEEMNQRIAALEKELEDKNRRVQELKERLSLKDSQRVELENEIETKYKRYIENYDKIGALVYEAQVKGDQMMRDAKKQAAKAIEDAARESDRLKNDAKMESDKILAEAELEARLTKERACSEAEKSLNEGRQKYVQIQSILNDTVEMINEVQRKFMTSYKDVHELVAEAPGSLKELDERMSTVDSGDYDDDSIDDDVNFETGELNFALYKARMERDEEELDDIPVAYKRKADGEIVEGSTE